MEVLHELHAGALEGHLGEDKTLNKVNESQVLLGVGKGVLYQENRGKIKAHTMCLGLTLLAWHAARCSELVPDL